jgi:tRNA (mo5U34)-methyltransferase
MQLPSDLKGLRVLDIGTSDGFFSLQMARRGADVVAIDYRDKTEHGYHVMEKLNPNNIDYKLMNIYELENAKIGKFDIIIFMGVLYHLPDMLRALHILRNLCSGTMYLETHSENQFCSDIPAARYYKESTLSNDYTNFWAPNRLCVLDMLHDARFDVERDEIWGERLFAKANVVETTGLRSIKMQAGYGLISG